ncbi:hypothetical protein ACGFIY_21060 [Micromonospora chersina]|uniref:hypothetical protein n=1 Tax=Micromonospora chersina TaxID=47854 RepID=UPI003721B3F9
MFIKHILRPASRDRNTASLTDSQLTQLVAEHAGPINQRPYRSSGVALLDRKTQTGESR